MKFSFHAAIQEVAGSCHLLQIGDTRLPVDCGLFQEGREIRESSAGIFRRHPECYNRKNGDAVLSPAATPVPADGYGPT